VFGATRNKKADLQKFYRYVRMMLGLWSVISSNYSQQISTYGAMQSWVACKKRRRTNVGNYTKLLRISWNSWLHNITI